MKKNFKQFSQKEEVIIFIEKLGQKKYRAQQIIDWIYKKLATSFDEMTDLSKEFRDALKKTAYISNLPLKRMQISSDSTRKFLFELEDGELIESVLIPNVRGENKFTLCISSQVGCALACSFCLTGKLGLKRNLKAFEIVDQVISASRIIKKEAGEITNVVFMGMGEPLNNLTEVADALWRLTDLLCFSKRKITVSTSGIVPKIYELAKKAPEVNLAISLNATTDDIRSRIMPINKKYPLRDLLKACREFPLAPQRRITFEYVLIDGVNNTEEDAIRLVKIMRGVRSKVNLIPYNPSFHAISAEGLELKKPSEKRIREFQDILQRAGVTVLIRKSMGADISAACGQLKASYL